MKVIMEELDLKQEDRAPVAPAREYIAKLKSLVPECEVSSVIALKLHDNTVITGKGSGLMDCCSAAILNAIKYLAGLTDEIFLLSPLILNTIQDLKSDTLTNKITTLNANEILIALSICAVTNPTAQLAYEKLQDLKGVQAHATVMLNKGSEQLLRELGIDVTCDPIYPSDNLYYV